MIESKIVKVENGYVMNVSIGNKEYKYIFDELSKAGECLTVALATGRMEGEVEKSEYADTFKAAIEEKHLMQQQQEIIRQMMQNQVNPQFYTSSTSSLGQYVPPQMFGAIKEGDK